MVPESQGLALLAAVLLLGLAAQLLLRRFQLPLATSLLIAGAVAGPRGFGLVHPDATLETFAYLGATFHLFLAGLEAHQLEVRLGDRRNLLLAGTAGLFPAAVAAGQVLSFGYGWFQAAFVGAALLSTSLPLVFSLVHQQGLEGLPVGRRLMSLAVTLDLTSAFALFGLLKLHEPHGRFPTPILLGLVLLSVSVLRMYVPEITAFVFGRFERGGEATEERKVRFSVALMLVVVLGYATLDVPVFVAAFLAGFSLAPAPSAGELREKLHLVGYALFVPVFLFTVGLETDPTALLRLDPANRLVLLLVVSAFATKILGGALGARWLGLDRRDSAFLGMATSIRLALSVSMSWAGFKAGLLDAPLMTAVVAVAVSSTLVVPVVLSLPFWRRGRG